MKKLVSLIIVILMLSSIVVLSGCSGGANKEKFVIGISQFVSEDKYDEATKGFKDAVKEAFGRRNVEFIEKNAEGKASNCTKIAEELTSEKVDLILANGTFPLKAVAKITKDIPTLGTSVYDYGVALEVEDYNGVVGGNITGTSEFPPFEEQAQMIIDLVPDAKKVAMLYCSAEADSGYQVEKVGRNLVNNGLEIRKFTFSSSSDLELIAEAATSYADIIYIPVDNTAASCAKTINKIVRPTKIPIISADNQVCVNCGVATISINYEELGRKTGEMAVEILKDGKDISKMPIAYADAPVKKYNAEICDELGIILPDGYEKLNY